MCIYILFFQKMNVSRRLMLLANRMKCVKDELFSPKNLLYTNVGISISLSAIGDILEQHYEILKVRLIILILQYGCISKF